MITQCCMQELYKTKNQNLIDIAKTFERRRCNHPPKDPLPPHECIKSIVIVNGENKHRYVIATENEKLRWSLRKIPGIPLIYMNRSVMVMEPLSKASAQVSRNLEAKKLTGGLNDVKSGNQIKEGKEVEDANKISKKRKGPKEPNPLSMKKKKTEAKSNGDDKKDEGQKKKRRRKHKKAQNGDEGEENDGVEAGESQEQTKEAKDESNDSNDSSE